MALLTILHLEDDVFFSDMVESLLHEQGLDFRIRRAATYPEYVTALRESAYGLILSDHAVPGGDGLEALAQARQHAPDTPFIFVTGRMGEEVAVDSLQRGAWDYVLKSNMSRFTHTVMRSLAAAGEAAALRKAQLRIRQDQSNLRALIENTSDAIWSMDTSFRIVVFNSAASLLAMKLGGEPMVVGDDFLGYLPERDRKVWREAMAQVVARKRYRGSQLLHWQGQEIPLDIACNPISHDGAVTGMAVFAKPGLPGSNHEPLRILVVEDNPVNLAVLMGILDTLGHAADVAPHGAKAVELSARRGYDLIFMDIRMPVMDGYQASRAIRGKGGASSAARIVAVTSETDEELAEKCKSSGMDAVLAKPILLWPVQDELARAYGLRKNFPSAISDSQALQQVSNPGALEEG